MSDEPPFFLLLFILFLQSSMSNKSLNVPETQSKSSLHGQVRSSFTKLSSLMLYLFRNCSSFNHSETMDPISQKASVVG